MVAYYTYVKFLIRQFVPNPHPSPPHPRFPPKAKNIGPKCFHLSWQHLKKCHKDFFSKALQYGTNKLRTQFSLTKNNL